MEEQEEEPIWKRPLVIIIGMFLIFMIIMMSVPFYSVRLDPEPKYIAKVEEVFQGDADEGGNDYLELVKPYDSEIKRAADKIIGLSGCKSNEVCNAKAMFYFVKENIDYVKDPVGHEYIKGAKETLSSGNGDCDDSAVLLANLLEAVGIRTRFALVPNHVYVEGYLPDSPRKYKKDGWVSMDATCSYCEFGEVAYTNEGEKRYLE